MNIKLVTMGSDPEYFLTRDGKIVPGTPDKIPGTKTKPEKISRTTSVQLDNVLVEMTHDPAMTNIAFKNIMNLSFIHLRDFLYKRGFGISIKSSHVFKEKDLYMDHCKVFGCEPDFSADHNDPVLPINPAVVGGLRTASGHLHLGFDRNLTMHEKILVVKMLDFVLGAPLLSLNNDPQRRTLYGQASRFRNTPYGLEYRTLDNAWTFFPAELATVMWSVVHHNLRYVLRSDVIKAMNAHHAVVAHAINTGNFDAAVLHDTARACGFAPLVLPSECKMNKPLENRINKKSSASINTSDIEREFLLMAQWKNTGGPIPHPSSALAFNEHEQPVFDEEPDFPDEEGDEPDDNF